MRPSPEIITYLATAACFGFGFYAVAWLIFAAFKYADTINNRTDEGTDPDFSGAYWEAHVLGENAALPVISSFHDRSNER